MIDRAARSDGQYISSGRDIARSKRERSANTQISRKRDPAGVLATNVESADAAVNVPAPLIVWVEVPLRLTVPAVRGLKFRVAPPATEILPLIE